MRKTLLLISYLLFILSISLLGYKFVSANKEIPSTKSIIENQKEQEKYLTPYGYTIENPNIIINPYENAPFTALIMLETPKEEEITINILEKDNTIKFQNTYKKNKQHYIPVYGLYSDYENKIEIKTKDLKKTYTIKTEKLPEDLIIIPTINNTQELIFLNNNGYIYALDSNNEVRWYLKEQYRYNIKKISNGNFIVPNSTINNNNHPIGFQEIDLLGKIYKQYNVENGYYGEFVENNSSYYILSKNLLEIDKHTGITLNKIKLKETYNNITYNKDTNEIKLENKINSLKINMKTMNQTKEYIEQIIKNQETISKLYTKNNYVLKESIELNYIEQTKETNKNIFIINYKKIDNEYKKYNIKMTKEKDLFKITGNFKNKEVYLILDKFLDKKTYKITNDNFIINTKYLNGKYSIYIKIDETIYKTNTYIKI